jgi:16S rRNA A1518/A1519 N6-dimethyltransferase RsmA/KsgA/DIM1 with predicted DNA glycosylase/AP lyase activity
MLRSSLKALSRDAIELAEEAGIDTRLRAEDVPVAAFARLAAMLDASARRDPGVPA